MFGTLVEVGVLGIAAVLTAMLSAVAGLGGGVILLGVMAQFWAPATAIPLHGAIQLSSNFSRAAIMRRNIHWPVVARASVLVLPASLVGVAVATSIPEDASRVVLAVFVLVLAWKPSVLKWRGSGELPLNAMVGVGAASGFLTTTVGASGPVTSPFFRLVTASHAGFVASAGAAQVAAHAGKVIAYGVDGFAFGPFAAAIAVGVVGVAVGSFIGSRLLVRTGDETLRRVFQGVLTVLAIRMLVVALLP